MGLTLLTTEAAIAGHWAARGIEVVAPGDPAAWLASRRWHVDLVLGGAALASVVTATQPQALIVDEPPGDHALSGVLARAGLA